MNKFVYDTMTDRGLWSQKRVLVFASFLFLSFYVTIPMWVHDFDVKEFVVIAIAGIGGFLSYRTQKKNENEPSGDVYEEEIKTKTVITSNPDNTEGEPIK